MSGIHCCVAVTRQEIDDALRVRWAVFGEEMGLIAEAPGAPREVDAFDTLETTLHFVAYADGRAVATVRLLLPNPEVARARGGRLGVDLERKFDLQGLGAAEGVVAEATRFCVLAPYRRAGAVEALDALMRRESRRRGVTHWIAAANAETDAAEDARIIQRVAERMGFWSRRFQALPIGNEAPPAPERCPFYTPEERERARAGDLAGLRLPRALVVFARRLGARFTGEPRYDARFRRFAMPLVAAVDLAAAEREESAATWPAPAWGASPAGAAA